MKTKNEIKINIVIGLLVLLLITVVIQGYQIFELSFELSSMDKYRMNLASTNVIGRTENVLPKILEEVMPVGVPVYGEAAKVNYDEVEKSLGILREHHRDILLNGEEMQRYIKIATTANTACEYCCGIGNAGFGTGEGKIACECSHNVALSGLTKWLIRNTDYTDKQIVEEIKRWKILFFPRDAMRSELQKRNVQEGSASLPSMVGGC